MLTLDTSGVGPLLDDGEITSAMPRALGALTELVGRRSFAAEMTGWLDLPGIPRRDIEAIEDAAKRIQDENDCLVVVGIGGSYLGARTAIEALPRHAGFPVLFAGNNLSPEYHEGIIRRLEGKRFALCAISKSGTTTEPAIAFRILRAMLLERFGEREARRRIVAITDPAAGALRSIAEREGWISFPIPPDVGGRFSVLSAVGLFPCAAAGIPVTEMLGGAASGLDRFTREGAENEAANYALTRTLLHEKGVAIEVLSTFHPELASLCEWWKQLAGESEGKNGKGLYPASTVMTTDLHSLGQYLQEGARDILETFLVSVNAGAEIIIPGLEGDPDGLNYLAGRPLSEVNRKAYEGTRQAHAAGGLPVVAIEIESITPAALGHLFVFFEVAVALSGTMLGVNPFNQPGVEEYKRRMFRLLGKPGAS